MDMKNYPIKAHNAILRNDAVHDFNNVVCSMKQQGKSDLIIYPKGASWQKIEDATAIMIKLLEDTSDLILSRGISYYEKL